MENEKGGARRKLTWTPEVDELILSMADGQNTIGAILTEVRKLTGDNRSDNALRKHMVRIGAQRRPVGSCKRLTQKMKDYIYVLAHEDIPITEIRDRFNEYFGTYFNYTTIWQTVLSARADKERPLTKQVFTEEWTRLQQTLAPDGAICGRHWLWRWHRMDESRTANGCVFHGKKEPIPHIITTQQFKEEWRKMQALFGIH